VNYGHRKANRVNLPTKTKAVGFKVTPQQHQALEQRATRCGVPLGFWIRSILLQAIAQPVGKHLKIREPDGGLRPKGLASED
jgi:hypothetical protein